MRTRMGSLLVFLIVTQMGLTVSSAMELSLDEFLNFVELAQVEITNGELEIIYKIDTLPDKSQPEAYAEAESVIQKLEENFAKLPPAAQKQSRHRQTHERNMRLGRKYLPQVMAGERHDLEKWSLSFDLIYLPATSNEPIFAHRFRKKDIKQYANPEESAFYHAGETVNAIFDGERTIMFVEAPPNVVNRPEQSLGQRGAFNYEIRQLIGRCVQTNLRKQDIEFFAKTGGKQSEYVLTFRIGEKKQILKKAVIDIEKGFSVMRVEYFSPPAAAQPYNVVEFLEYQFSSGVWHPRKITRVGYQMTEETRQISSTEEWVIKEAVFDIPFPDDFFHISEKLRSSAQ